MMHGQKNINFPAVCFMLYHVILPDLTILTLLHYKLIMIHCKLQRLQLNQIFRMTTLWMHTCCLASVQLMLPQASSGSFDRAFY